MASPYDLTHAGQRPAKRPYVDNRTAALAAATAQFDSLVREQAHQEEIDAAVQLAVQQQQQFASTSTSQFAPVSNEPPKRKITRKRQVLSCRPCTTRKIRCTRTDGPGAPCQSCEKRGEAALCDVGGGPGGTTPAPSPGPSTAAVAAAPSYGQQTPQQQQQHHHHHHHHHRHPHHAAARAPSPGSMLPALPPALAAAASPGPFAYGQVLPPPMHHAINIASPGSLDSESNCADHRAELERRIAFLESALLAQGRGLPSPGPAATAGGGGGVGGVGAPPLGAGLRLSSGPPVGSNGAGAGGNSNHRTTDSRKRRREAIREGLAWPDGPDSETEDAALTLEDIAVNVRIAGTQMQRRAASISTPILPSSATTASAGGTPNLGGGGGGSGANAPMNGNGNGNAHSGDGVPSFSREKSSLIVPEISRRYRGVLIDLYEALPSRDRMDWLIRHYIDSVSWYWCAHHLPTLAAEYDAFCELVAEGRQLEIDPLWLAVLFLTLALSANSLDYIPAGAPLTRDDLVSYVPDYFEAARAALDCGDAFGSARIRTIQAIAMLGPLALNSGDQGRVDILIPYVAGALRLCQQLKLDKLGKDDPSVMPPEDPALPSGINSLRREVPLRLFYALLHVDQVIFRLRPVLAGQNICSALPGNYDDKDLRSDAVVPPPPLHVRSFAQYETLRFRVGAIQRRLHEANLSEEGTSFDMMVKCDGEIRNLLAEYELERTDGDTTIPLYWARVAALQNVHIRLIRFHRPFASRGYRDPKYRSSTDAALASARVVLETQKELDKTNAPLVKDCYQLNHIQVSIVVLFCEVYQQHDPAAHPPGEIDLAKQSADYRLISEVSVCFHRAMGSVRERVRAVARQSLLVLQYLFEALHALRPDTQREAFGHLLKRISVAVTEAERGAAAAAALCAASPEAGIKAEESNVRGANTPDGQFSEPPAPFSLAATAATAAAFGMPVNGGGNLLFGDLAGPLPPPAGMTEQHAGAMPAGLPSSGGGLFDGSALAENGDTGAAVGDFAGHDVHFGEMSFDWGYD
ncbi:hypothetical protein RHOSPDRAFT_34626 [Rhodotorula sp. JG-1b]|nr:hypothetical protein RHOSPDRAFT_34626 [Rhodotorula sp. JG-1b]